MKFFRINLIILRVFIHSKTITKFMIIFFGRLNDISFRRFFLAKFFLFNMFKI